MTTLIVRFILLFFITIDSLSLWALAPAPGGEALMDAMTQAAVLADVQTVSHVVVLPHADLPDLDEEAEDEPSVAKDTFDDFIDTHLAGLFDKLVDPTKRGWESFDGIVGYLLDMFAGRKKPMDWSADQLFEHMKSLLSEGAALEALTKPDDWEEYVLATTQEHIWDLLALELFKLDGKPEVVILAERLLKESSFNLSIYVSHFFGECIRTLQAAQRAFPENPAHWVAVWNLIKVCFELPQMAAVEQMPFFSTLKASLIEELRKMEQFLAVKAFVNFHLMEHHRVVQAVLLAAHPDADVYGMRAMVQFAMGGSPETRRRKRSASPDMSSEAKQVYGYLKAMLLEQSDWMGFGIKWRALWFLEEKNEYCGDARNTQSERDMVQRRYDAVSRLSGEDRVVLMCALLEYLEGLYPDSQTRMQVLKWTPRSHAYLKSCLIFEALKALALPRPQVWAALALSTQQEALLKSRIKVVGDIYNVLGHIAYPVSQGKGYIPFYGPEREQVVFLMGLLSKSLDRLHYSYLDNLRVILGFAQKSYAPVDFDGDVVDDGFTHFNEQELAEAVQAYEPPVEEVRQEEVGVRTRAHHLWTMRKQEPGSSRLRVPQAASKGSIRFSDQTQLRLIPVNLLNDGGRVTERQEEEFGQDIVGLNGDKFLETQRFPSFVVSPNEDSADWYDYKVAVYPQRKEHEPNVGFDRNVRAALNAAPIADVLVQKKLWPNRLHPVVRSQVSYQSSGGLPTSAEKVVSFVKKSEPRMSYTWLPGSTRSSLVDLDPVDVGDVVEQREDISIVHVPQAILARNFDQTVAIDEAFVAFAEQSVEGQMALQFIVAREIAELRLKRGLLSRLPLERTVDNASNLAKLETEADFQALPQEAAAIEQVVRGLEAWLAYQEQQGLGMEDAQAYRLKLEGLRAVAQKVQHQQINLGQLDQAALPSTQMGPDFDDMMQANAGVIRFA